MSGAKSVPLASYTGLDWLSSFLGLLLVEGKFFPLFALLFGWGIARRQQSAGEAGRPFFLPNLRRMGILALFGLLHAALLWEGDILLPYALAGALLPLARRFPTRMLWPAAAVLLLLSSFLAFPGPGDAAGRAYSTWVSPAAAPLRAFAASANGVSSPIPGRLAEYGLKLIFLPTWFGGALALILAGYIAGQRERLPFLDPGRQGTFSSRLPAVLLLGLAILLNGGYALTRAVPVLFAPDWAPFVRAVSLSLGGPLLALFYAAGILCAWAVPRLRPALEPLACLGRMPLTAYITQSALGLLLFSLPIAWWSHPGLLLPLTAVITLAQVGFARAWLSRRAQGPLEAAWRNLSGT
jgi:uncharacterized protein